MTKRDLNNLSDTELLTRLLRLEEHVLDGRTPDDLTVEEFAAVADMPTNSTISDAAPVQSVEGQTGDVVMDGLTITPAVVDATDDVSIGGSSLTDAAAGVYIQDTEPTAPDNGSRWTDSSASPPRTKIYDGSSGTWIPINAGDRTFVSDTEPTGLLRGDIWFDTSPANGTQVFWYNGAQLKPLNFIYALPDDGLSGYSISDPDSNLELTDTSLTLSGSNITTSGRVFQNITLSDYEAGDTKLRYKVDFNMSACDKGQGGVYWSTDSDASRSEMTTWVGVGFTSGPSVKIGNSSGDNDNVSGFSLNSNYTLTLTYDFTSSSVTAELFDTGGTSLGSGSVSSPATSFSYFYPFVQRGASVSYPGELSGVMDNVRWETVDP